MKPLVVDGYLWLATVECGYHPNAVTLVNTSNIAGATPIHGWNILADAIEERLGYAQYGMFHDKYIGKVRITVEKLEEDR